jgi:hypothetical protein
MWRAAAVGAVAAVTMAGMIVNAAPASAAAWPPEYETVTNTSAFDSLLYKSVTVTCPAGKRVIGTGFSIDGSADHVVLDDLIPNTTSVTVGAGEDLAGSDDPWSVTAQAVCANWWSGLEIVSATSSYRSGDINDAEVSCPNDKRVVGTGVALRNGWGEIAVRDLAVRKNMTGVYARATRGRGPYEARWSVTAYAICTFPPGRTDYDWTDSAIDSVSPKDMIAACPSGSIVLGQGWATYFDVVVLRRALIRDGSVPGTYLTAGEEPPGWDNRWVFSSQPICFRT